MDPLWFRMRKQRRGPCTGNRSPLEASIQALHSRGPTSDLHPVRGSLEGGRLPGPYLLDTLWSRLSPQPEGTLILGYPIY